jgi:hypothetical protein
VKIISSGSCSPLRLVFSSQTVWLLFQPLITPCMRVLGNEREIVKVSLLNGLPPWPKLQKVTYLKRVLSIHIYMQTSVKEMNFASSS